MSKTGLAVIGVVLTMLCGTVKSYAAGPGEREESVDRHVQVTYDLLSTLPLGQRRAVYVQVSGTAKADLWQLCLGLCRLVQWANRIVLGQRLGLLPMLRQESFVRNPYAR